MNTITTWIYHRMGHGFPSTIIKRVQSKASDTKATIAHQVCNSCQNLAHLSCGEEAQPLLGYQWRMTLSGYSITVSVQPEKPSYTLVTKLCHVFGFPDHLQSNNGVLFVIKPTNNGAIINIFNGHFILLSIIKRWNRLLKTYLKMISNSASHTSSFDHCK